MHMIVKCRKCRVVCAVSWFLFLPFPAMISEALRVMTNIVPCATQGGQQIPACVLLTYIRMDTVKTETGI